MSEKTSQPTHIFQLPPDCANNQSILELNDKIRAVLENQPGRIELDGSRVLRLGSVAIGTLAVLAREARTQGAELVFCKFTDAARRPFEICRIEQHFCWED